MNLGSGQPDPQAPTQHALFVGGSGGADILDVQDFGDHLEVSIKTPEQILDVPVTDTVSRVVLYGGAGDDLLSIGDQVSIPAWLFGCDGNDNFQALGSGPSLLSGGEGNDQLQSGPGRSIMIGGRGSDTLIAGSGGAILIGCTTDHDLLDAALDALLDEWSSSASYSNRIAHLQGTLPGGQNGSYLLTTSTVHDDGTADTLQGGSGDDWFFAAGGSRKTRDRVTSKRRGEVITILPSSSHAAVSLSAPALYDPASSTFYLGVPDSKSLTEYSFGGWTPNGGCVAVTGDWNGDGSTGVGVYDPKTSIFYLTSASTTGSAEYTFGFGVAGEGWIPLVGDWNGDGQAGIGLYDPKASVFYLSDTLQAGYAEYAFGFGVPEAGWTPLVADWNGDGQTDVGLYDPKASLFYLTETFQTGYAEHTFGYGQADAGWQPLVGDWDGDQAAGVGLYDPHTSRFYLTSALATGYAEYTFGYGEPRGGWKPLVGDWDGDNRAGVGLYAPLSSTFYLTNSLATGYAEYTIRYGQAGAGWQPLIGRWTISGDEVAKPDTKSGSSLNVEAVDQVDLADLAAQELGPASVQEQTKDLIIKPSSSQTDSELAIDLMLQGF